jgi:hypothetical protein
MVFDLGLDTGRLAAGNVFELPFFVEFPGVKKTAQTFAIDFAFSQMGPHMWAEGIHGPDNPIFAAINGQFAAQKVQGFDLAFF